MTMLKPKEMADRLGVTVRTLQIWDVKGILKANRTPTNRRYYTEEQYLNYVNNKQDVANIDLLSGLSDSDKQLIFRIIERIKGDSIGATNGKG